MDESSVLHVTRLRKIFHKEQKVGIKYKPDAHRKNLGIWYMIFFVDGAVLLLPLPF